MRTVNTVSQKNAAWKAGLAKAGVIATAVAASASASAFDISTVLSGSDAESNADAIGVFVLGVCIVLFTISMARRGLGK